MATLLQRSNSHTAPTVLVPGPSGNPTGDPQSLATRDFHSIVGGAHQDGLFGLDEIDANSFVVVGSTGFAPNSTFSFGTADFPFTTSCVPLPQFNYGLGVVAVFDASMVPNGPLQLLSSSPLGTTPVVSDRYSVARDVVVQRGWAPPNSLAVIVGSTDDTQLVSGWNGGPQIVHGGSEDGFVVAALVQPSAPVLAPQFGMFLGNDGQQRLTGIQSWNEFPDYFVVAGTHDWNAGPLEARDIQLHSFYLSPGQVAGYLSSALFGGVGDDRPAVMGSWNATTVLAYDTGGLGDPAGGGVSVDSRARVTVVGATDGAGYPVTANGRGKSGAQLDGVRTYVDLVPDNFGVGRTDGTGTPPPVGVGPYPPPAPVTGGTSPECALAPFGSRIGQPSPLLLQRMLVDVERLPGNAVDVLVMRTPATANLLASALQFGFPGYWPGGTMTPYTPLVIMPDGLVVWTVMSPMTVLFAGNGGQTVRIPLGVLQSPLTFTVQLQCLLDPNTAIIGGLPPNCATTAATINAASPALWINL